MELIFRSEPVSRHITRIRAFGGEYMYLVEGEYSSVLIDTAMGYGRLAPCVRSLTSKPLGVLLTHGHVDHAMGSGEFSTVRISPLEREVYATHSDPDFRDDNARHQWRDYSKISPEQIMTPKPFDDMLELRDGDIYPLGDISVEVLACPGHTPGSMVMLIPEERTIMLGDACNDKTFMFDPFSGSVRELRDSLARLLDRARHRYDRVLLSHGRGEGPADMVERVLALCDEIMEGRDDKFPFEFMGQPGFMARALNEYGDRRDHGFGNVLYNPNRIF